MCEKKVEMPNQTQCPNCGGYKITYQKTPIQQRVLLSDSVRRMGRIIMFIIAVPLLGASVLVMILGFVFGVDLDMCSVGSPVFAVGAVIVLLIAVFNPDWAMTYPKVIGNIYHFSCDICGYRWEWHEGQPVPPVNLHPGLIAKGSEKFKAGNCKVCGQPVPENVRNCYYCGTARW
jgi:hypothetical protein